MTKIFESGPTTGRRVPWPVLLATAAIIAFFFVTDPVPQDPAYHLFADGRRFFSIPNFLNVFSNVPFLIIGGWGLIYLWRVGDKVCMPDLRLPYVIFFVGILTTAFGSGYFHLAPGNDTLVWDRLPMTIGFAGFFAIIIGEFVSARAARLLLLPFLVIGAASVTYWAATEAAGSGDLRPYAIVQFLPMLLIPVILVKYPSHFAATKYFWWMIGFYVLAKVLEQADVSVFNLGNWVSGHSLKHLSAAVTPAILLYALMLRRQAKLVET